MSTTQTQTESDEESNALADLWTATKTKLENLGDNPAATGELANEFAAELAQVVHAGDATETAADPMLKQFARNADMKKSAVESQFETELDELEEPEDTEATEEDDGESLQHTITHLLEFRLKELTIYQPSDASASPRYEWVFDTGVSVETETEHLAPDSFCQAYHDAAGGELTATTPEDFQGAWPDYIRNHITELQDEDNKVRVIPVEGVRTQAVEDLQNVVESKPATTDIKTAAQQLRPYVEDEDADIVQVPSSVIERLLSNFEELSYNDLQIELDKREYRAGNVRKTQVGRGTNVRFWQLSCDWLDIEVESPDDAEANGGDTRDTA